MKKLVLSMMTIALSSVCFFTCNTSPSGKNSTNASDSTDAAASMNNYGGFPNQVAWGVGIW